MTTQNVLNLAKKEKQAYEALAALITYIEIKDVKKREWKTDDFTEFKRQVLATVKDYFLGNEKNKTITREPKFRVKYYERAILLASEVTYRDMAIQAANKDLTKEAMEELVTTIYRNCCQISRQLEKETMDEWRKAQITNAIQHSWQNVIELDEAR